MPSTSKKQRNFMAAAAHNPAFAKKVGIPVSVAKEFNAADKGKKFKGGGMAKDMESKSEMKKEMAADKKQDVAMIKKAFKEHDAQEHKGGKGTKISLKKGGMAMKKTMGPRNMSKDVEAGSNKLTAHGESAVQKRGKTKGMNLGDSGPTMGIMGGMKAGGMCGGGKAMKKMSKGGSASARADGIASKGKTSVKVMANDGPKVSPKTVKGGKGGPTGEQMRKMGRNMARANNQK